MFKITLTHKPSFRIYHAFLSCKPLCLYLFILARLWEKNVLLMEVTLDSVPETKQSYTMRVTFPAQENNGSLGRVSNTRLTDHKSEALLTMGCRPF